MADPMLSGATHLRKTKADGNLRPEESLRHSDFGRFHMGSGAKVVDVRVDVARVGVAILGSRPRT